MGYRTISVDVDVYVDEVLADISDQELIDEAKSRGYDLVDDVDEEGSKMLTDEEKDWICYMILKLAQLDLGPTYDNNVSRSIYDKLRKKPVHK